MDARSALNLRPSSLLGGTLQQHLGICRRKCSLWCGEGEFVLNNVYHTPIGLQDIQWLIVARAVAGIGAGGIVSLVWTITAEIVEADSQAKWSQALSVTWACSAIAGPLLGGVFSGKCRTQ